MFLEYLETNVFNFFARKLHDEEQSLYGNGNFSIWILIHIRHCNGSQSQKKRLSFLGGNQLSLEEVVNVCIVNTNK